MEYPQTSITRLILAIMSLSCKTVREDSLKARTAIFEKLSLKLSNLIYLTTSVLTMVAASFGQGIVHTSI